VERRAPEIGIRMVQGAGRGRIARQFVGEGLRWTGLGLAAGTAGALACWRPAWRAVRLDPWQVLRQERVSAFGRRW